MSWSRRTFCVSLARMCLERGQPYAEIVSVEALSPCCRANVSRCELASLVRSLDNSLRCHLFATCSKKMLAICAAQRVTSSRRISYVIDPSENSWYSLAWTRVLALWLLAQSMRGREPARATCVLLPVAEKGTCFASAAGCHA